MRMIKKSISNSKVFWFYFSWLCSGVILQCITEFEFNYYDDCGIEGDRDRMVLVGS